LNRLMVQMLRLRADAVIAVSEGLYRELTQQGIPSGRCHLIPNGVDVSTFDAIPPPPLSPNGSPRIVGTVGRLIEQKGVDVFIDAAALVVTHAPDVEFWIAGDGPLRETCRRRIAAHGMNGRMSLLGERADIPLVLRALDLFVLPSVGEGISNAILEAMATGLPVVATRVGGNGELVSDGLTGRLIEPRSTAALAQAIRQYLDDPVLGKMHGRAARDRAERDFSLERMLAGYEAPPFDPGTDEALLDYIARRKASFPDSDV